MGRPAPVVMLMLDELPLRSLVDADGQLDAELFPHLAALQERHRRLPQRLEQRVGDDVLGAQRADRPAAAGPDHPGRHHPPGQRVHPAGPLARAAGARAARAVPRVALPPAGPVRAAAARDGRAPAGRGGGVLADRPAGHRGGGPGRCAVRRGQRRDEAGVRVRRRDGSASPGCSHRRASRTSSTTSTRPSTDGRPSFDFLHLLIPHSPWVLMPDGRHYRTPGDQLRPIGLTGDTWNEDGAFVPLGRQRHLLQLQYADRLVGELVRRLKASGQWDRSAVVITADHGVAFTPGAPRRETTPGNRAELAWVPLFVKRPGQHEGTHPARQRAARRRAPDPRRPARRRHPVAARRPLGLRRAARRSTSGGRSSPAPGTPCSSTALRGLEQTRAASMGSFAALPR